MAVYLYCNNTAYKGQFCYALIEFRSTSKISTNGFPFILLNILQDSSFSNQITFILHIQDVFSLPGRGFQQRVTLISSVPMTLDDVIVHVRQFIIALVSVDGCCSFSDPDGFFDVPDSSVGFLVYNVHSLPVYDVVFSCCMVCKGGFIDGRHKSFFPAPCVFLFFRVVYILSVFIQSCF